MALESLADRRALLAIDGVAVRVYPGGSPVDRVAQYDGPSEAVSTAYDGAPEVIQTAPSLYMLTEDLVGLPHGSRVEVLEGPGAGDWIVMKSERQEDGAFSRLLLADRT